MPHLVILYTPNLERPDGEAPGADLPVLCRALADTMLAARDDAGKPVFPPGGTRVLAYPAAHWAVSDDGSAGRAAGGSGHYGFIYMNLRMARGRPAEVQQRVGQALLDTARTHLAPLFAQRHVGLTVQVDEGGEVFDGKHSTLHPLFNRT